MNALSPIEVTLSGIITLERLVQLANALFPISVTLSGMVMLVKLLQFSNTESSILITLSGIVYSVSPTEAKHFNIPSTTKQRLSSDAHSP